MTQRYIRMFLAGICFGLATLTRELAVPVAGVACLWLVASARTAERRATVARCAVIVLILLVVVAPWTYRNFKLFGRIVPVSTVGWFAIREGNAFTDDHWIAPDLKILLPFRALSLLWSDNDGCGVQFLPPFEQ